MRILVTSLMACVLVGSPALAHDLWLEPVDGRLERPGTVRIMLALGEALVPEQRFQIDGLGAASSFVLHSRSGTTDLLIEQQQGLPIELSDEGIFMVGMERSPTLIELEPSVFRHYLEEEQRGDLLASAIINEPVRERFSRHLKALISVGNRADDAWSEGLGQKLEIVPLANPLDAAAGDTLRVRLLFEGEPLSGVPISIHGSTGGPVSSFDTRTDAQGVAALTVPDGRRRLIRAMHIRQSASAAADYESFWAAFSFEGK